MMTINTVTQLYIKMERKQSNGVIVVDYTNYINSINNKL